MAGEQGGTKGKMNKPNPMHLIGRIGKKAEILQFTHNTDSRPGPGFDTSTRPAPKKEGDIVSLITKGLAVHDF